MAWGKNHVYEHSEKKEVAKHRRSEDNYSIIQEQLEEYFEPDPCSDSPDISSDS